MNNSKMLKMTNKLIHDSLDYWYSTCSKYNITEVSLNIYGNACVDDKVQYVRNHISDTRAVTVSIAHTDDNLNIDPNDRIIKSVTSEVYISLQELYAILIDTELDFNKALKTMEFTLRHEIGHIIVKNKFVDKPIKEWDKVDYEESIGYNGMPTLRKNASKQARLEWLLQYNSLPSEKAANDAVDITEEDIIEDFNRLS